MSFFFHQGEQTLQGQVALELNLNCDFEGGDGFTLHEIFHMTPERLAKLQTKVFSFIDLSLLSWNSILNVRDVIWLRLNMAEVDCFIS